MKTVAAEIRYAERADAAALASIHEAAWQGAYAGIIPHRTLRRMIERRCPSWWRQAVGNRAAILVLEFGGKAIGYATLGRNRTPALSVEAEIYELYLLPQYQGLGFGRRLFDAARDLLKGRGLKGVAVWALAENDKALAFYAARGGANVAEGSETFEDRELRKVAFVWR